MGRLDNRLAVLGGCLDHLGLPRPQVFAHDVAHPTDWIWDVRVLRWVEQISEGLPCGGGGGQAGIVCPRVATMVSMVENMSPEEFRALTRHMSDAQLDSWLIRQSMENADDAQVRAFQLRRLMDVLL